MGRKRYLEDRDSSHTGIKTQQQEDQRRRLLLQCSPVHNAQVVVTTSSLHASAQDGKLAGYLRALKLQGFKRFTVLNQTGLTGAY